MNQSVRYENQQQNYQHMSTLPALFIHAENIVIRPRKQGGIFTIRKKNNLTAPQNTIQSRTATSCTKRTLRTRCSATLGVQRPYSRQSSISNNYATLGVSFNILENKVMNAEETDNLTVKAEEGLKQLKDSEKIMDCLVSARINISQDLEALNHKICKAHQEIMGEIRSGVKMLRNNLSALRRESGMEIKVNDADSKQLKEQLQMINNFSTELNKLIAQKASQYMQ